MRQFAGVIAICVACSSWAMGAGGDQLSSRLKQYDQGPATTQLRQPGNFPNNPQEEPAADGIADSYPGDSLWDDASCPCGDDSCDWSYYPCRHLWGRAEYLSWWVRGSNTPALLTTSPDTTPLGIAGVLPGATVVFGDQRMNQQGRSGGRFTLGNWFGDGEKIGVEDTFFYLGNSSQSFQASSGGSPILARPFFDEAVNPNTGAIIGQNVVYVAFPNVASGTFKVASSSKLLGNEINLRRALYIDPFRRIDVLAGYRFVHLGESLQVSTNTTSLVTGGTPPPPPVGTTFAALDSFITRNQFNGGQLGLNTEFYNGRWGVDLRLKLAIGSVSQRVNIAGSTVVTEPSSTPVTNVGGVLALPSNIGQFNRNQFGVLPEFGVNLNYQLTPCWRVNVGYTLLGLTNVVRPGDQIDVRIDSNQIPPAATAGPFTFPRHVFHNSDLLVQGINVGLECNF